VTLWCAVVTGTLLGNDSESSRGESSRVAPFTAVAVHNDAMWVSHQLIGLALRWRVATGGSTGEKLEYLQLYLASALEINPFLTSTEPRPQTPSPEP
jgi:hypothetical protein